MKVRHRFIRSRWAEHVAKCEHCGLRIYVCFVDFKESVGRMTTRVFAYDENGRQRSPGKIPCDPKANNEG